MDKRNTNILKILLTLALFTGATIEISEGSIIIGILLFLGSMFIISKMELNEVSTLEESSKTYILLGLLIVFSDLIYNMSTGSKLGTLDSMTFFLGISLIAWGTGNKKIDVIGELGTYTTFVFIVLYLIFYSGFNALNIDFLHLFDHYFVLLPTATIINLIGIPIEIIAIETVIIHGTEPMTIVIGGPCSGLYSMFLLIGIVAGYSRIEEMNIKRTTNILGIAIIVAYIANLIRVIILYVTAYFYGMEMMMLVHTHIGWIIFAITAGSIMYIMNKK